MAYDPGALEAALVEATGDDPWLIDDLRTAFLDRARVLVGALRAAPDADAWTDAADRLRGLAASFCALRVLDAAAAALAYGRSPAALTRIERALAAIG